MVKLTQINDESSAQYTEPLGAEKTEVYTSDSESDIDDDEFDIETETIYERVVALKDIIAPESRNSISTAVQSMKSYANSALKKTGSITWALTSSALLLAVPLSLAILAETQIQEMEKEMSLQQSAQDVMAPGSEAAFAEKKVAA